MNFAALLAVLAAAAFTLPLVVRGAEAVGLSRGVGVMVSAVLALGLVATWAIRQHRDRATRGGARAPGSSDAVQDAIHSISPGLVIPGGRVNDLPEAEEAVDASL